MPEKTELVADNPIIIIIIKKSLISTAKMTNLSLILIVLLANNILFTIQQKMDHLNSQSEKNLLRILELYKQRCTYEQQGMAYLINKLNLIKIEFN